MADLFDEFGIEGAPQTAAPARPPQSGGGDLFDQFGVGAEPAAAPVRNTRPGVPLLDRFTENVSEGFEGTIAGQVAENVQNPATFYEQRARQIEQILADMGDVAPDVLANPAQGGPAPMASDYLGLGQERTRMPGQGTGDLAGLDRATLEQELAKVVGTAAELRAEYEADRTAELAQRQGMSPWYEEEGILSQALAGATALAGQVVGSVPSPENLIGAGRGNTLREKFTEGAYGGVIGGGVAEPVIQGAEISRGERDEFSAAEAALNTVVSGLAGGTFNAAPTALRNFFKARVAERNNVDPDDVTPDMVSEAEADPEFVADFNEYRDVLEANNITDETDPRAATLIDSLNRSRERKASRVPGRSREESEQFWDERNSGEVNPAAQGTAGRRADVAPPVIELGQQSVPMRPGETVTTGSGDQGTRAAVDEFLSQRERDMLSAEEAFTIADMRRKRRDADLNKAVPPVRDGAPERDYTAGAGPEADLTPRMQQELESRARRPQPGVGENQPGQPRNAVDRISSKGVDVNRGAFIDGERPQPDAGPQPSRGDTFDNDLDNPDPRLPPSQDVQPEARADAPPQEPPARPEPAPAQSPTSEAPDSVGAADAATRRQQVEDIADRWEREVGDSGMAAAVRSGLRAKADPDQATVDFQQRKLDEALAKRNGTAAPVRDEWTVEDVAARSDREKKDFAESRQNPELDELYAEADDVAAGLIKQFNDSGYSMSRKEEMPADMRKLANEVTGLAGTLSRASKQGAAVLRGYKRANPEALAKTIQSARKAMDALRRGTAGRAEPEAPASRPDTSRADQQAERQAERDADAGRAEEQQARADADRTRKAEMERQRSGKVTREKAADLLPDIDAAIAEAQARADADPAEARIQQIADAKEGQKLKGTDAKMDAASIKSAQERVGFVEFRTRTGTFKVRNTPGRLQEFRKRMAATDSNRNPTKDYKRAEATPQTRTAIKDAIMDGDIGYAYELAKAAGEKVLFGSGPRGRVNIYPPGEPQKIAGLDTQVVQGTDGWAVLIPETGLALTSGGRTKAEAIKTARERAAAAGEAKVRERFEQNRSAQKQAELEADFRKQIGADRTPKTDAERDAQKRQAAVDEALAKSEPGDTLSYEYGGSKTTAKFSRPVIEMTDAEFEAEAPKSWSKEGSVVNRQAKDAREALLKKAIENDPDSVPAKVAIERPGYVRPDLSPGKLDQLVDEITLAGRNGVSAAKQLGMVKSYGKNNPNSTPKKMSPRELVAAVKALKTKGTAEDLLELARNMGFERLAPVIDALENSRRIKGLPVKLINKQTGARGSYATMSDDSGRRIEINTWFLDKVLEGRIRGQSEADIPDLLAEVIVHELVHAATLRTIYGNLDPEVNRAAKDIQKRLKDWKRANPSKYAKLSGFARLGIDEVIKNVAELPTYGMASPEFQDAMKQIPGGDKTMFDKFVELVRKAVGLKQSDTSLLNDIIQVTKRLMDADEAAPDGDARYMSANLPDNLGEDGVTFRTDLPEIKPAQYAKKAAEAMGGKGDEWRDFPGTTAKLAQSIKDAVGGLTSSGRASKGSVARDMFRAVLASTDGNLRMLAGKFDSPTLKSVADMFHATAGRGDGVTETFDEAVSARMNTRLGEVDKLSEFIKANRLKQEDVVARVENRRLPRKGKLGEAADMLDKFMREELRYMKAAGVDVGEVRDGYFPREMDTALVGRQRGEFINAAARAYKKAAAETGEALSNRDAMARAEAYWENTIFGDSGTPGYEPPSGMGTDFTNSRVFSKAAAKELEKFYVRDIDAVLGGYTQRAVRRAEIAKRFGDRWSKWSEIEDKIKAEDPDAQNVFDQLRDLAAVSAGVQRGSVGSSAQHGLSMLRTWTTLGTLEKASLASLGELVLAPMRGATGNLPGDLARNMTNIGDHVWNTMRGLVGAGKSEDLKRAYTFAQDLGAIAGHGSNHLMAARFAGGDPVGQLQSKAMAAFFRRTMLEQLTNYTRVTTLKNGQIFLRRLSANMKDADGRSSDAFYLRELGVPAGREKEFAEFVRKFEDRYPEISELQEAGELGKFYKTAMLRFTDQTVMRPSNSTRPKWAASPLGAVIFQLQSFGYAFQKNVINRYARVASNTVTGKDMARTDAAMATLSMAGSLGVLVAFQALLSDLRRKAYSPNGRELTEHAKVEEAISRAGLFGAADPWMQSLSGVRYNRPVLSSLVGPALGGVGGAADQFANAMLNNSENTNTAERNLAKATYNWVLEPAMQLALTPVPFSAAVGLTGAYLIPRGEDVFVDAVAGERTTQRGNDAITGMFESNSSEGRSRSRERTRTRER